MTIGLFTATQLLKKLKVATADLSREGRVHALRVVDHLTCKAGCAYCCYQKLVSAPWEGIHIYLYLKATGSWTPALRERLVQADRDLTDHTHRQWLLKRVPCVFLRETEFGSGTCTVYSVRPMGCIATYSETSDPANCAVVDGASTFGVLRCGHTEGRRAEIEYSKAIGRLLPLCEPIRFSSLPGVVLRAEALVEGLAPPDVHSVELDESNPGSINTRFDEAAKEPDPQDG